jgi:hypothetical protein
MMDGQNVILISPRRYGKSSLLREAIDHVRARRGQVGLANFYFCSDRAQVADALANAVISGALGWLSGRVAEVEERIRGTGLALELKVGKDGFSVSGAPRPHDHDWNRELRAILRLLRGAGSGKHPVALAIDEFQRVVDIDEGLAGVFKAMVDEIPEVSLVLAGSQRRTMERLAIGPHAPLLGVGEPMPLDVIPEEDMVRFLIDRAKIGGKLLAVESATRIYEVGRGVPYYVQELAYHAFAQAEYTVTLADVELAVEVLVGSVAGLSRPVYERLRPLERKVLLALAEQPAAQTYSADFLARSGVRASSSVERPLEELERVELVELSPVGWRVANPFMEIWIRTRSNP